jgi:hypothetical protein
MFHAKGRRQRRTWRDEFCESPSASPFSVLKSPVLFSLSWRSGGSTFCVMHQPAFSSLHHFRHIFSTKNRAFFRGHDGCIVKVKV